jgi:hypothetical protein
LTRALQQLHRYSITSAQSSSDSGGDNPSVFAVFRLMDQLDRGALDDRRKTFH